MSGNLRHSFSEENEKLTDRGWSGDGAERMRENASGAGDETAKEEKGRKREKTSENSQMTMR